MIKYIFLFGFIVCILLYLNDFNFKNSVNNTFQKLKLLVLKLIKDNNNFKNINLNYVDSQSILKFLQSKYNYDNILIPKNISYLINKDKTFSIDNFEIIGNKFNDNIKISTTHIISLKFVPLINNTFISNQDLFGINGNFYLISDSVKESDENEVFKKKMEEDKNVMEKKEENKEIYEEKKIDSNNLENKSLPIKDTVFLENDSILNKVPDIIHLTSESEIEIDSIQETTEDINQNIPLII